MPSVKFLHCADLHIGASESFLGTLSQSRRFEALLTFDKIIDLALENDVDLLLIAGDLFDSNNVENVFKERVFDGFRRIGETKIVFAAGNHDPLCSNSPFLSDNLPQNLYLLKTDDDMICFEDIKTKVYGKSFSQVYMKGSERFSFSAENDGYNHIMCIHGELRYDLGSDYNSITTKFITESRMDYIALGHIHKRTEIGEMGGVKFAYSGCAEGQGFDESGEKGVYLGSISQTGTDLQFIPVSKRLHIIERVDISECEDSFSVAEKIKAQISSKYDNFSENLYKVILIGETLQDIQINIPEILSIISQNVYYIKIKDETEIKLDLEALAEENSLKGIFVKKITERIESAEDEQEKSRLKYALKLGLNAFKSEVVFNDNQ